LNQNGGENRLAATNEKGPVAEKIAEIELIRGILESSKGAILADYRGLNVKNMSVLRKRLRETDSGFRVVKNTLVKRAAAGLPAEKLVADLEGPTGLLYTSGDPAVVAKTLTQFIREFKLPVVKGAIAEGFVMGPEQLTALAAMPPRQVLLAQVVGGLQAPVSGLVSTMQQLYGQFVYALQGVADKKGG
jgi:large subunit ribosomal protein L10